jgi:DNA-binding beta-propeller fold protein YncE
MTIDPNNCPGGPHLILTAKSANKVQFFDAVTLAMTAEIDMPASTHEMIRSPDGSKIFASVYGGGIFGKNKDPDCRIAVIDLASKTLERTIDVGDRVAPHSLMLDPAGTLWSSAELGHAVLAIDPDTDKIERIDVGGSPHWIAISHSTGKLFASFKTKEAVAVVDTGSPHWNNSDPAGRRRNRGRARRRDFVRVYALERRGARHRCTHVRTPPQHHHRRCAGRGQSVTPRTGVAGWPLRLRVIACGQFRRGL